MAVTSGSILDQLQGMTPDEAQAFLSQADLTPDEAGKVFQFLQNKANGAAVGEGDPKWVQVSTEYGKNIDNANSPDKIKEQLAIQVAGMIAQAAVSGRSPDFSRLANALPSTMTRAEKDKAARDIMAKGEDLYRTQRTGELTSQGVAADTANKQAQNEIAVAGVSSDATPRWILQAVGAPLTPDQKDRITKYWNDYYGTDFTNFDRDVAPLMSGSTPNGVPQATQDIVTGALLASEPEIAMRVVLPGGKSTTLTVPQMKILREQYGMDNDAISRIVRLTSMQQTGFDNIGNVNFQPMIALLAAKGQLAVYGDLQRQDQAKNQATKAKDQANAVTQSVFPGANQSGADVKANGNQGGDLTKNVFPGANQSGKYVQAHPGEPGSLADIQTNPIQKALTAQRNEMNQTPGRTNVAQMQAEYDDGLKRFNSNPTLAFLYALDHGLAERIAQSGGDPSKLSGRDNAKAMKYLVDGGLVSAGSTPFEQMGGASGDMVLAQLSNYFKSYNPDGANGDGTQRQMPDPVAVEQSLSDMWRATFRTEPSDELKRAFNQDLTKIISETDPNQTIDVTARIQDFIRQQPLYRQLYKNNTQGLTDQQYQGMFEQGVASILGNVPDTASVQAGMKTGDYQTAVFSASTSKEGQNNSTLQERLAQAFNTIAKNT